MLKELDSSLELDALRGTTSPSPFVDGLSRVLDIGAVSDPLDLPSDPIGWDEQAIASDWLAVGRDLLDAANRVRRK